MPERRELRLPWEMLLPPGLDGASLPDRYQPCPPCAAPCVTPALLLLAQLLLGASQLPWGSGCPLPYTNPLEGSGTSAVAPIRPWAMSDSVSLHTHSHLLQERMGSVAPRGDLTSLWLPQCSQPSFVISIFSACCSVLLCVSRAVSSQQKPLCSTEPLWGLPEIVCS